MKTLSALIKKEFLQMFRDPSTIIIAFVLPLILLLIYMYGIDLDTVKITIGLKNEDPSPQVATLVESFNKSKYIQAIHYDNREQMNKDLVAGKINGFVVVPNDFTRNLARGKNADLQLVTDGSEVNLSNYVLTYPNAIANSWLAQSEFARFAKKQIINPEIRYWYNQEIDSHYFILPGSLAITMTLIGMILTALVIAREWERGTMEAILATRVRKVDIILSKYIPYFALGMASMMFNVLLCVTVFEIPFRGNYLILFGVSSLFLLTTLGFGLLISTNFKDQFLASQMALAVGFLPVFMLSGLTYPINSMPWLLQMATKIIPARYFITFIQSEFMAGTIWYIVLINSAYLLILVIIMLIAVYRKTNMRLDNA